MGANEPCNSTDGRRNSMTWLWLSQQIPNQLQGFWSVIFHVSKVFSEDDLKLSCMIEKLVLVHSTDDENWDDMANKYNAIFICSPTPSNNADIIFVIAMLIS